MRLPALAFAFVLAIPLLAAEKQWQAAMVADITPGPTSSATVTFSSGNAVGTAVGSNVWSYGTGTGVSVPVTLDKTYYWIDTDKAIYVLLYDQGSSFRMTAPNLKTVGIDTKIAIEGKNAFVLDDKGKEVKLPIFKIVLKPSVASP